MKSSSAAKKVHQVPVEKNMIVASIQMAFAMIEFEPNGTIITANELFLKTVGYSLAEIVGKHHKLFVDETLANSLEYRKFWDELALGRSQIREFKRLTKGGTPIWIRGSYLPVFDEKGRVRKILKLAQDCTQERLNHVDSEGKITAISRSQAVIEFNLDGTIITANDNFLGAMGYRLDEVQGKHHAMFVEPSYAQSQEYHAFWANLNLGKIENAQYKRLAKGGKEVWIQASYNPIFDLNGKPYKVVKYATDVTKDRLKMADYSGQISAINKSQAVIEFNLDGTVIQANDNFLATLGYSMAEIQGKHHSMFCEEGYRLSHEYRAFWEKLNRGDFESAQYKRVGKGGREVWIQGSYNPIMDLNGKPFKVVKYATDITDTIKLIHELSAASTMLTESSTQLSTAALQMSSYSERTSEQANAATITSDTVSRGVEQLAINTEEMQASIKEIARNANEASNMSNDTKNQAQATNQTIQKLAESSKEIGNVIKVISSIAQQTNLLALNATIEAARAGDAGRGFAVVANEVKELAKQTAKATEEITNKIGAIQTDSSDAVKAISGIGVSIDRLNAIAGAIAASVEEQAATTSEVARVVRESNNGVQGITENVRSVKIAAIETSSGATQVMGAAKGLQTVAARLQDMVKRLQQH